MGCAKAIKKTASKTEQLRQTIKQKILNFLASSFESNTANYFTLGSDPINLENGYILDDRFDITQLLGQGTFGKVFEAVETETDDYVAIKIIKESIDDMQYFDTHEIQVLQYLKQLDPECKHLFIEMYECFISKRHVCIVYEVMSFSIRHFYNNNCQLPFEVDQIRYIAYQVCYGLKFIHSRKLTHCDIKPDNILFVYADMDHNFSYDLKKLVLRMRYCDIRICDFGCAVYDNDHHPSTVGTRSFAPPEIALKLKWSHPFDVWSTGVLLFFMYNGENLFGSRTYLSLLARMEMVLGPMPMILRKSTKMNYFDDEAKLRWNHLGANAERRIKMNLKPFKTYKIVSSFEHTLLFDLIQKMLIYDQKKRITMAEAFKHPFFDEIPECYRLTD